jgi:3-hydroxymyristoyl/3-hydroxydecanoyl-(acyl carrier protein) dehydratase
MSVASLPLPLAHDHPAYAGHFPGMPIMPGVVLLDEALHAIGQAMNADLSSCRINAVKFLSPLKPGEPVRVDYEALATGAVRFDIVSGERKVATGSVRPLPAVPE